MFCTNCGKEFEGNFCPSCGTPAANDTQKGPDLTDPAPQQSAPTWNQGPQKLVQQPSKGSPIKKFFKWVAVVICCMGFLVYTINLFTPQDITVKVALVIADLLMVLFLYLLLRKKKPKVSPQTSSMRIEPGNISAPESDVMSTSKPANRGKVCDVCGVKLHTKPIQIKDGSLCPLCNRICSKSPLATVEEVNALWERNHQRFQNFNSTMVLKDAMSGYIYIDTAQELSYISNQKTPKTEPIVFHFSEIEEYRIEQVGQKTITKKKGGITRAVVGGAMFGVAGAIVGANTAKEETKQTGGIPILYIDLNLNGVKTTVSISNPPVRATEFLDNAMETA